MSDFLWSHGLLPTRLLHPWDFPGEYWSGLPLPSPFTLLPAMKLKRLLLGRKVKTNLNCMHRGAWWAAVHGVTKSWTWLSAFTLTFHFHVLEKEMATHSSVLAWRILGMGEPGGLPSMGSHRVGHDWSNLAAAAAAAEDLRSGYDNGSGVVKIGKLTKTIRSQHLPRKGLRTESRSYQPRLWMES